MDDDFDGSKINSPDYWNKRFFEDWIARGGRKQTAFFAELCCRELPDWFVEEACAKKSVIFDYGCALGDALPVLRESGLERLQSLHVVDQQALPIDEVETAECIRLR